ncbi:YhgE/Pip family protein [Streptomyces sp. 796.1]|uniref:YhgE/Pip family protein n=1 Tax=Streptomyces sp. 796.1 TaxID=3163029 RepID=UPI0039C9BA81
MRSPKLAALELRRFGRGKLPRVALVTIMLLPLLYGALYLWSFWDPYTRLDKLPVALVNADAGATVDGEEVAVGDELVKNLRKSNTFDWQETSPEQARDGVEKGRYYLSLTVPSDFSDRIASSAGDAPEAGALQVHTNDANNYLVGSISRTVFSEVRAAASTKASRGFYDKIFVSFSDLHGKTADAAKGADDLGTGIGKAKDGADKLHKGLDKAEQGSKSLKGGVTKLHSGAGRLKTGAGDVAAGTQQLADKVNAAYRDNAHARDFLKEHGAEIGKAAKLVADASQRIGDDLGTLPATTATAAGTARSAADELAAAYRTQCATDGTTTPRPTPTGTSANTGTSARTSAGAGTAGTTDGGLPSPTAPPNGTDGAGTKAPAAPSASPRAPGASAVPDGAACGPLRDAVAAARSTAEVAEDLNALVQQNTTGLATLAGDLGEVRDKARWLARHAPGLGQDVDSAVAKINALNAGAHQVATGATELHTGLTGAKNGATSLHTGVDDLHTGAGDLDGGLFKLVDGSEKLAGGLHDGARKIPDLGKDERDARTEVMADPVKLAAQSLHKAPNYGTGFAPYFIPLSLWVGVMVAYMLIQPLNRRALAAGASPVRIALAGWLPVAAIGVVQTAVLLAVLHWGLGLQMARTAGTAAFLTLATCCFAAIVQWLNARFGPAGRILVLALLMLQLTSAGGTYPVQTSPAFFNALHPLLPMSYVVDSLRRLITGGDLTPVWQGSVVLAAFTLGALALTTVTARRKQVWSVDRLHPELTL